MGVPATLAQAAAARAVVPVKADFTVAMIELADVSLYLQHKLKSSLLIIIIQAVPMAIAACPTNRFVLLERWKPHEPRWSQ